MSAGLSLAVLISGNGSNLQAIIDAIESGELDAEIATVVSNEGEAYGLERARAHGITTRVIDHRSYAGREDFDAALSAYLQSVEPDYIVLAGFMRILGANIVASFADRILNIHPSLLPSYKGLDTYRRALANHEARHGVSIHLVTAALDDGPVIVQGAYPIEDGDGVAELQRKGHALEHRMYPAVLRWLSESRLTIDEGRFFFDRELMHEPLQFDS